MLASLCRPITPLATPAHAALMLCANGFTVTVGISVTMSVPRLNVTAPKSARHGEMRIHELLNAGLNTHTGENPQIVSQLLVTNASKLSVGAAPTSTTKSGTTDVDGITSV